MKKIPPLVLSLGLAGVSQAALVTYDGLTIDSQPLSLEILYDFETQQAVLQPSGVAEAPRTIERVPVVDYDFRIFITRDIEPSYRISAMQQGYGVLVHHTGYQEKGGDRVIRLAGVDVGPKPFFSDNGLFYSEFQVVNLNEEPVKLGPGPQFFDMTGDTGNVAIRNGEGQIQYLNISRGSITLNSSSTAAPEPSSVLLMSIGAAGMFLRRRRK